MVKKWLSFIACGLVCACLVQKAFAQDNFNLWLEALKQEAIAAGISEKTATATINHVALMPSIIELDRAQPEFISPFLDYYQRRVDAAKVTRGQQLAYQYEKILNQLEVQYGVPKALLIAFWGMETNYGSYQGRIDTLSALTTLAYDGRRATFFRNQLLDAMRMIDSGDANIEFFRGSWAGAFGNMQFMPTTFITYAIDGDGDHRIDMVNSASDALASAANYLSQVGWREEEPIMIEVQLPTNFQWQNAQLNVKKSVGEWVKLGVKGVYPDMFEARLPAESGAFTSVKFNKNNKIGRLKVLASKQQSEQAHTKTVFLKSKRVSLQDITSDALPYKNSQAAILLPQGWRGPAFMVFNNFDAVMDWNRSVNYALSVILLAKQIDGESAILGGQLAEKGALTFQQMMDLQTALNARGFNAGEPDGFPGLQTQAAVRDYQLSQFLPADGYASPSLYDHLLSTQ